MLHTTLALSFALPAALSFGASAPAGEHEAIERAILDYAESYYEARPDYVERGISKELVKLGFSMGEDGAYKQKPMDYDGFMRMVDWVVENGKPPAGPKEVVILDALDKTALVKLTGSWGIDYMQVTKEDDRWQTRHVVWQSLPPERTEAQQTADIAAVEAAVQDYLMAFYDADPERLQGSVHPELAKYGFWKAPEANDYRPLEMTFDSLGDLATSWNNGAKVGADAPREIEVFEVMDRVACAKLTAVWGTDYVHLIQTDGQWQILQILWQSPAEATEG